MEKWIFAVTSIVIFDLTLNFDVSKFCRKKTSVLGGEELICHNASVLFFKNANLGLTKTHWLTCDNCTLQNIDSSTFNFTKNSITFLYLTSSQIYMIRELAFSKFKLMRVLNLRNNTITELEPKAFTNLKKLNQLDLSHNSLRILVNAMFEELPDLNLLNLNYNTIYYIQPDAFKGLTNLRHLYLNNNELEKLEGHIFKYLPNLLLLYLENNNIVEIDSFAFVNLENLNSLYLNNNSITFLTQYNFKPLNKLSDLQLRGNKLSEIQTSAFNGLTNLKYLYLGNNQLSTVKRYGFIGLDNLQNLELINNDFETFDLSYIQNMKHINMVWLQENRISNLTLDFKVDPLDSLHSLGLNDNNLTALNYKLLFNKMPNIRDIFIYNNTWKCEFLVNMFNFFQERNVSLCSSLDCSFNKTKTFVEEACVTEDLEDDFDSHFVTQGSTRISAIFVLLPLQMFIFM